MLQAPPTDIVIMDLLRTQRVQSSYSSTAPTVTPTRGTIHWRTEQPGIFMWITMSRFLVVRVLVVQVPPGESGEKFFRGAGLFPAPAQKSAGLRQYGRGFWIVAIMAAAAGVAF